MKSRLINHINLITDPKLRKTCEFILKCDDFFVCPASLGFHHNYEGGLLAHTVEVCDIALRMILELPRVLKVEDETSSLNTLLTAALFHDLMKTREYSRTRTPKIPPSMSASDPQEIEFWEKTEYSKTIGHICGSAAQFKVVANIEGVEPAVIDRVVHCILAHHGRREWGSPVEPQTLEALILHQADMLSAHYGTTK